MEKKPGERPVILPTFLGANRVSGLTGLSGGPGEGGPFRWVTLLKMKARDQENMAVPGQKVAFPGSLPGMCGRDRDPLPMVPGPICLLFNKSSICLVDPNALPSQGPRQHLRCINKAQAVGYRIRPFLALLSLAEQFPS